MLQWPVFLCAYPPVAPFEHLAAFDGILVAVDTVLVVNFGDA